MVAACVCIAMSCSKQAPTPDQTAKDHLTKGAASEFDDAIMLKAHSVTGEPLDFFDEKGAIPQGLTLTMVPKRIPQGSYQPADCLSYWMTLGPGGVGEQYRDLCSKFPSLANLPDDQKHSVSFCWRLHPGPQIVQAFLEGHENPIAEIESEVKPGSVIDLAVPSFTFVWVALPHEVWSTAHPLISGRWHMLVKDGEDDRSFAWNAGGAQKGEALFWAVRGRKYSGWIVTKSITDEDAKTTMWGYAFRPFQVDKNSPLDPEKGMIVVKLQLVGLDKPPIIVPYR
jgi:hypothetical protein